MKPSTNTMRAFKTIKKTFDLVDRYLAILDNTGPAYFFTTPDEADDNR
jgi:hypothetical protein